MPKRAAIWPAPHALAFLLWVAVFTASLLWYGSFLSDDALISARYAVRLAAGQGLSWNDGYWVEGYSNLAWVLAIAGLYQLGLDPIVAMRGLGVGLTVLAMILVFRAAHRHSPASWLSAAIVFAAGMPHLLPIWALGGLEAPLVLACLVAASLALARWWRQGGRRWLWAASAILAVLCLARPDGPLFAAIAALLPLLARRTMIARARDAALLLSLPVAASLGQLGFRLATYGALVPNTARIKIDPSIDDFFNGLHYIGHGHVAIAPAVLPVLIAIGLRRGRLAAPVWIALAMSVAWCAYLTSIGGDFFYGYRHMTPVLALGLATVIMVMPTFAGVRYDRAAVAASVAGLGLLFFAYNFTLSPYQLARKATWPWDCRTLALALRAKYAADSPVIAVTAAGCLPYWTGFETLDLLGLNDLELPNRPPTDAGDLMVGHRFGDLDYLLERAPEIVVFHTGSSPNFAYKRQIAADGRFAGMYCATVREIEGLKPRTVYLRRDYAARRGETGLCVD